MGYLRDKLFKYLSLLLFNLFNTVQCTYMFVRLKTKPSKEGIGKLIAAQI